MQHFQQAIACWFLQILTRNKGTCYPNSLTQHSQRASFEWVTNFLSLPLISSIVASPREVPLRLVFSCCIFSHCISILQVFMLPTPWERDWLSQPPKIVWLGMGLIPLFVVLLPHLSLGQGCVARIVLIIV